jgi:hypothetical protein
MFIIQIDELFDNVLIKFHNKILSTKFTKILLDDINFVKHQNQILKFIQDFIDNIPEKDILNIVKTQHFYKIIINIIKRYCAYYIYLTIAYHYTGNHSLFITNLIESSKYQKDATIQIENFYTSQSNSKIIQYFYDIKNLLGLFSIKSIDKIKILLMNNPLKYASTIKIFSDLGEDYIVNNFLIENNIANIIKTLIIKYIYNGEDKEELIALLNFNEKQDAEYKFIEIIISNKDKLVDYTSIKQILSKDQIKAGFAEEVYDYIYETANLNKVHFDDTRYILLKLFTNKILVPITEDFLKYHKENEKYDIITNLAIKDRDSTKIKYIINKMNKIINFNAPIINTNPKLKLDTLNLFYKQLDNRKAVLYNDIEDLRILSKLELLQTSSDYDFIIDLKNIRKYAYMNFKDLSRNGFKLRTPNTIECIRYTSVLNPKMNPIETRIGHDNIDMNIIGVAFNPSKLLLSCVDYNKLIDVRKLYKMDNGYNAFIKSLTKSSQQIYYWLFNNNDLIKVDKYVNNTENSINSMMEQIYHEYINISKNNFYKYIDELDELNITQLFYMLKRHNILNLHNTDINQAIAYAINTKLKEYPIVNDIPPKLTIIKLPSLKNKEIKQDIINIGYSEIDVSLELSDKIIPLCHHYIKWTNLMKQSRNPDINQLVFNFVKQYVKQNVNGEYICKSCNEMLYLQKYVHSGTYVEELDEFLTTSLVVTEKFEESPIYSKYQRVIKNLEKNIEKIGGLVNIISYIGNDQVIRLNRKQLIKNTIDLILLHTEWLRAQSKSRNEEYIKKYNTNQSNLFFFELKDDIFLTSSTDTDQYKIIKYNNIIAYLVFIIISELNFGQIINLKEHKKYNYFIYSHVGTSLFANLYLRISQKDKIPLINLPILAYVIYYMSGMMLENHIWLWNSNDIDTQKSIVFHKNIIHTIVDIMNTICEINFEKEKNYLYAVIGTRFFSDKLKNVFNDTKLLKQLETLSKNYIKVDDKTNKITFISKKTITYDLYIDYKLETKKEKICSYTIRQIDKNKEQTNENNDVSILSNCPDGKFHSWIYKNNDLVCNKCNQSYNDLLKMLNHTTEETNNEYLVKIKLINLRRLTLKYCISGVFHDLHANKCTKCGVDITTYKPTDKELLTLEKNLLTKTYEDSIEQLKKYEILKEQRETEKNKSNNILLKLHKKYNKLIDGKINNYIDDFIDRIFKLVGNKLKNIYIKDTLYIIDHDYLGNYLKEPITILSSSNKIEISYHEHFKKEILYYKLNQNYVYYDIITLQYLGYSDNNKTIKTTTNIRSLRVDLSLRDMLYLLGYENKYLNLYHLNKNYINNLPEILKTSDLEGIIRNRVNNLKHIITRTQSIIFNIINKGSINSIYNLNEKNLISEFVGKIQNFNTRDKDNKKNIFKNYRYILNKLKMNKVPDKFKLNIMNNYVDITNINNLNNIDTQLIFYLIYNFNRILDYNNKSEIGVLLVNIINYIFNLYYIHYTNYHIQKFDTLLFLETPYIDDALQPVGMYQELLTKEEIDDPVVADEKYDDEEAKNALDIDDYDDGDDEGSGAISTLHGSED